VGVSVGLTIKKTGNIKSTSHQFGIALFMMIGTCVVYTGGLSSSVLGWICIAPLGAMLIGGGGPALLWSSFTVLLILTIFILGFFGSSFESEVPEKYLDYFLLTTSIGLAPVVAWMCYAFEFGKTQALGKLSSSEKELSRVRKDSAINSMAFSIAHEVNSPLTTINLAANRVLKLLEREEVDKKALSDKLIIINSVTERVFNLTRGLGYFSLAQARDEKMVTTIGKIMKKVMKTSSRMITSQKIKIELHTGEDDRLLGTKFECLYGPFISAIQNLIDEAAHNISVDKNSKIDVYIKVVEDNLVISIGDSGGPISEAVTKFLEHPFEEGSKLKSGLGLRLGIAVNLITMHDGKIDSGVLSSHERFIVKVPMELKKAA
jgi:signal transduction histidine kinase